MGAAAVKAPVLPDVARAVCAEFFVSRNQLVDQRGSVADSVLAAREAFAVLGESLAGASHGQIETFLRMRAGVAAEMLTRAARRHEDSAAFRRRVLTISADLLGELPEEALDRTALADPDIRAQLDPRTVGALEEERAAFVAASRALQGYAGRVAPGRARTRLETLSARLQRLAADNARQMEFARRRNAERRGVSEGECA